MNKQLKNCLSVGDTLMPEMHLRQTGFVNSVCEPFTKTKKELKI